MLAAREAARAKADALKELARRPRITGMHLCAADRAASAARTEASRVRGDILVPPMATLMIDGCSAAAVQAVVCEALAISGITSLDAAVGLCAIEHERRPAAA